MNAANKSRVEPQYKWEIREDYVRNTKTGDVFYSADACPKCYKPRQVAFMADKDYPELVVHCTHYQGREDD